MRKFFYLFCLSAALLGIPIVSDASSHQIKVHSSSNTDACAADGWCVYLVLPPAQSPSGSGEYYEVGITLTMWHIPQTFTGVYHPGPDAVQIVQVEGADSVPASISFNTLTWHPNSTDTPQPPVAINCSYDPLPKAPKSYTVTISGTYPNYSCHSSW